MKSTKTRTNSTIWFRCYIRFEITFIFIYTFFSVIFVLLSSSRSSKLTTWKKIWFGKIHSINIAGTAGERYGLTWIRIKINLYNLTTIQKKKITYICLLVPFVLRLTILPHSKILNWKWEHFINTVWDFKLKTVLYRHKTLPVLIFLLKRYTWGGIWINRIIISDAKKKVRCIYAFCLHVYLIRTFIQHIIS